MLVDRDKQEHGVCENDSLEAVVEDYALVERLENACDLIEPCLLSWAQESLRAQADYFDGCDAKYSSRLTRISRTARWTFLLSAATTAEMSLVFTGSSWV